MHTKLDELKARIQRRKALLETTSCSNDPASPAVPLEDCKILDEKSIISAHLGLLSIPKWCLVQIFEYFSSVTDLYSVACTCKKLHSVGTSTVLWRNVESFSFDMASMWRMNRTIPVPNILFMCRDSLKTIHFSNIYNVPECLTDALRECKRLETIECVNCSSRLMACIPDCVPAKCTVVRKSTSASKYHGHPWTVGENEGRISVSRGSYFLPPRNTPW